jgi:hypothetical protein
MAWTEHHLVTSPSQLRTVLDELCRSPARRRLNCFWYDTVIGVWVIQRGQMRTFVDLRGLIIATTKGRPVPLDLLIAEDFDAEEANDAGALPTLKFDWRQAEKRLPALEAPLMESGDTLTFAHSPDDQWLANTAEATLGSHFMP